MSRSTMRRTVGVLVMEHIAVGLVEGHKVAGPLSILPEKPQALDPLQSMPAEGIVDCIRQQVDKVAGGEKIAAIGIGFPGIIRNGVVEDSPNFHQAKGFALQGRSEEHTSELQSQSNLVCRLLLEKKKLHFKDQFTALNFRYVLFAVCRAFAT